MRIFLMLSIVSIVSALATVGGHVQAVEGFNPITPSQLITCDLVDNEIEKIPHGNGIAPVTYYEVGPGGWRFDSKGQSFITTSYILNNNGTRDNRSDDFYMVLSGRSSVGLNYRNPNDYPTTMVLTKNKIPGAVVFSGIPGEVILNGKKSHDDLPLLTTLPVEGLGQVQTILLNTDGDGIYEGCVKSPVLKKHRFFDDEAGNFLQRKYYKVYMELDSKGTVIFFECTEIGVLKNTIPGFN